MAHTYEDRTRDPRSFDPRADTPARAFGRRIDCADGRRPGACEAHGRGRGIPDPESLRRAG